jgi:thymidylate kinase
MINKLISLSGLDSAGKSTQIEKLEFFLNKNNQKTKVIWSRGGYTPLFNFLKVLLRSVTSNKLPSSGESKQRDQAFEKKWISTLWLNIAIIDLIIFYAIYFRLLNLFGYTVISDRYLYDTYVDWKLGFKNNKFEVTCLWKILKYLSPIPKSSFLLTISVEEALRRSSLKNEPFSEDVLTRENRRKIYNELINKGHWKYIIDAHQTVDEVWSKIKSKL